MDDGLKNRAYLEGSRLKNAGYDDEVIAARLEKQGLPQALIEKVIRDLSIQQKIDNDKNARPFYNIALFKVAAGVLLAIITAIVVPGEIFLPLGLIFSGIVWAVITRKNMI